MATINYDFYDGKDIYNDGNIEEKLLSFFKNNRKQEFYSEDMFYTTTQIRENILNWFPFSNDQTILEIGAGVGTITEMLCDKCKNVVSVEASKRRAEIIYERCKEKENLEVYVANLNDLELKEKFDYIALIGVFEYAKIFCDSSNPFVDFLDNIKKYLKPNGKILLAIENRYGIKYFAGNKEDHLNEKYIGLYGYDNYSVQTFGKKELISIFEKCGLNYNKFYYVFPDYKLPQVIYTDYMMPTLEQCSSLPIYNHGEQNYEFDIRKVMPGIIQNGQLDFFANSFLVELGFNNNDFSDVAYVKHQPYRTSGYQMITIIDDKNNVYKICSNKNSYEHLKNIYNNHKLIQKRNINICDTVIKDNKLEFEYIEGKSIYEIINELKNSNSNEVEKVIDDYISYILNECSCLKNIKDPIDDKLLEEYKGRVHVLKLGLLDLNMGNVIINKDNKYCLIDQEWCSKQDLPSDYAIYFSIKLLFETMPDISSIIEEKMLYKKYNISSKKQKIFNNISINYFDDEKKFKDMEVFKKLISCSSVNVRDDDIYEKRICEISNNYEVEIQRLLREHNIIIDQIYNSTSWKVTKPFRSIMCMLKRKKK